MNTQLTANGLVLTLNKKLTSIHTKKKYVNVDRTNILVPNFCA